MLNREISDAIFRGDTDEQILKMFAAIHGPAMLVTPVFQGFERLLWIVPSLVGSVAVVLFLYGFRKLKQNGVDR